MHYSYYIEQTTNAVGGLTSEPDIPSFEYQVLTQDNGNPKVKINWRPNIGGHPGSHFLAQYRRKGESSFTNTEEKINEDFIEVGGLDPNSDYEIRVVSVDGAHQTPSASRIIRTSGSGKPSRFLKSHSQ